MGHGARTGESLPTPPLRGGGVVAASSCSGRRSPGSLLSEQGEQEGPQGLGHVQAPARPALPLPPRSEPAPPSSNLLRVLFSLSASCFRSRPWRTCGHCSGHSAWGRAGMVLRVAVRQLEE